jgi:hypothetical protein
METEIQKGSHPLAKVTLELKATSEGQMYLEAFDRDHDTRVILNVPANYADLEQTKQNYWIRRVAQLMLREIKIKQLKEMKWAPKQNSKNSSINLKVKKLHQKTQQQSPQK